MLETFPNRFDHIPPAFSGSLPALAIDPFEQSPHASWSNRRGPSAEIIAPESKTEEFGLAKRHDAGLGTVGFQPEFMQGRDRRRKRGFRLDGIGLNNPEIRS